MPKPTQQSVILNTPSPDHATSSSQKLLDAIIIDDVVEDIVGTPIEAPPHPLLRWLQVAASTLPNSIPLSVKTEDPPNLFCLFGFPPNIIIEDGADPWEDYVNPTFHVLQGYSPPQIAEEIQRGQFGVDGLCHWVEISIGTLKSTL